ncbi:unnamed protein product [Pylaiella littoralis]
MGLADMAGEVLRLVTCLLEQKDVVLLGKTCRPLYQIARGFAAGKEVFPLRRPTVDERHGNEDKAVEVDMETGVLRKTTRPGMGTIMAKERVDKMTCYWEVKIETFTGVRLEIGVATRRSIYRGGCNKDECWVFDCYGRACHGARVRGYGCKLQAGDVVGVLLNTADSSLSFFLQGECMGTAFRNVRAPPDRGAGLGLYPLVVLPSVAHEAVRLAAVGDEADVEGAAAPERLRHHRRDVRRAGYSPPTGLGPGLYYRRRPKGGTCQVPRDGVVLSRATGSTVPGGTADGRLGSFERGGRVVWLSGEPAPRHFPLRASFDKLALQSDEALPGQSELLTCSSECSILSRGSLSITGYLL